MPLSPRPMNSAPGQQYQTGGPRSDRGLVSFVGNAEIEERAQQERDAQIKQNEPVMTSLASHISGRWTLAKQAKNKVERQMLDNLRQRRGEYDQESLAQIKAQGGSEVFINISNVKCRAVEAWLKDIMLPPGERPWAADPTPVPELPESIKQQVGAEIVAQIQAAMQQGLIAENLNSQIEKIEEESLKELKEIAQKESKKMENEIDDELVEGQWYDAVEEVLYDIATYPAGIVYGPFLRMEKCLEWASIGEKQVPRVVERSKRSYMRVSPFDIFPGPGAKSLQHGDLCHKIRIHRSKLSQFIGVEGYDDAAIRLVLSQYPTGYKVFSDFESERYMLEERDSMIPGGEQNVYDVIKFMGPVQGLTLLQWGMSPENVPDPLMDYEVVAYMVGSYIISARLNPHPLGKREYHSAAFEKSNDSVWGKAPIQLMSDIQKICNGCARALVNNMGMASGPMMWVYANRLATGESITSVIPWKIYRMARKDSDQGGQAPLGFFQPANIVEPLLKIYDYFFKQASEVTGVPAYMYGAESKGGAGDTASGLSMLMNAASKGLKLVAGYIDKGIIKSTIEEHWLQIMLYEPEKARGDIKIVARASDYLIMMEQLQLRRQEFLQTTANPIDLEIMGKEGRAEVLRETAKALKIRSDKVVPSREDLASQVRNAEMQEVIQNIAATLQLDPELVAQIAFNPGGQNQAPQGGPQQQGPDGAPMGGNPAAQAFTRQLGA